MESFTFVYPRVIRPFRVTEVTTRQLFLFFNLGGKLPATGPIVYLLIRVLRPGFEAAVKLTPETFLELEGAHRVGKVVFLLLQFGIVVGELVEQNGDGHAIKDDAKGDTAECHTAAEVGDGDNISIAHSGDADL